VHSGEVDEFSPAVEESSGGLSEAIGNKGGKRGRNGI